MTEHHYQTQSADETIALGGELASLLKPPMLLILRGDLGAGKTTLVKGIAAALGAAEPEAVTSPTFTLVHEYEGAPQPGQGRIKLYHLDLYRLDEERQLNALGIDEMLAPDTLVLIEWGEKFPSLIAQADGEIAILSTGIDVRSIFLHLHR